MTHFVPCLSDSLPIPAGTGGYRSNRNFVMLFPSLI